MLPVWRVVDHVLGVLILECLASCFRIWRSYG